MNRRSFLVGAGAVAAASVVVSKGERLTGRMEGVEPRVRNAEPWVMVDDEIETWTRGDGLGVYEMRGGNLWGACVRLFDDPDVYPSFSRTVWASREEASAFLDEVIALNDERVEVIRTTDIKRCPRKRLWMFEGAMSSLQIDIDVLWGLKQEGWPGKSGNAILSGV